MLRMGADVAEVPKFIFGFILDLNVIKIIQQAYILDKNQFVWLLFCLKARDFGLYDWVV